MLTSTARIQAYPGANPEQNPLFGMIVKRSYLLDNEAVKVRFSFQNPSKDNMTFGIRINNLPNPGIRFSDKGFTATYMANGKQLSMPPSHCIFLKRNTSTSFLSATPRKLWDGGKISLSARDGMLHDSMDIIPDGHFNGIYSWFRGSGEHVRTIELLGQFTLKPGEQKTCEYSIRTSQ
jgi:hypothetical protein